MHDVRLGDCLENEYKQGEIQEGLQSAEKCTQQKYTLGHIPKPARGIGKEEGEKRQYDVKEINQNSKKTMLSQLKTYNNNSRDSITQVQTFRAKARVGSQK
jgi:hypothetical protein